jgi:hypothetical protein
MHMALSSRLIFTVIGVTLPIAAHLADMSQTHIYNPHWPPHAKFHNGQTLSMSLLLGFAMDLLPSPDSAEAQPGGNNDRRQVNHIYHDCKSNSPDRLRLEFWIEIGRIGV